MNKFFKKFFCVSMAVILLNNSLHATEDQFSHYVLIAYRLSCIASVYGVAYIYASLKNRSFTSTTVTTSINVQNPRVNNNLTMVVPHVQYINCPHGSVTIYPGQRTETTGSTTLVSSGAALSFDKGVTITSIHIGAAPHSIVQSK